MKSMMPWVCLVAVTNMGQVFANEGVDAYRVGQYKDAAMMFAKNPTHDPVVDYYMGRMRLYGYGELKDNNEALRYFKQSAEKGFLPAQNLLARYSLLQENNLQQALYWFNKAANLNDIQAQMYCASAYLFGIGTQKNSDAARRYYIAAAKNGNAIAQYTLAENFLSSRQGGNKTLGMLWLNKSIAQGNPDAELLLARLYANGKLIEHDVAKAESITSKLADNGYLPAMFQMGEFARLQGNMSLAKEWYLKASSKQYHPAQMALAQLYLQEKGPLYDPQAGFLTILTAAQEGSSTAQLALSNLYKTGIGVDKDENIAKEWQQKAVDTAKDQSALKNEAIKWLSNDKAHTYAECGYVMPGILSAWNNQDTLKENSYNQAPRMNTVSRDELFKPQFVMTNPNQISIGEYYGMLVRSMNHAKQARFTLPRYSFKLTADPKALSQVSSSSEKEEGYDYLQQVQAGQDQSIYEALFKKLEGQAILGDTIAQFDVAQMYQYGVGVAKNIDQAIKFYTLATKQQDLRAEYNLGLIYLEGIDTTADYKKAMDLLKDAAFKGSPFAQYVIASINEQGYQNSAGDIVIAAEPDQAIAMYDLAATNNLGLAQNRLADILVRDKSTDLSNEAIAKRQALIKSLYQGAVMDGVEQAALPLAFYNAIDGNKAKQTEAFSVALKEAKAGNLDAALLLGLLYDRGIGVAQSQSNAIEWYQKAGSNAVSSFILGSYLSQGIGGDKDLAQGKALLAQSAEAGFSYANLNLAILNHENNETFLPELNKALELGNSTAGLLLADYYLSISNQNAEQMTQARSIYQHFADAGDKVAEYKLGFMFEYGLGGSVDMPMAQKWYLASAEQGQLDAQYLLGHFYQLGRLDNQPNYLEAKKWYAMAQKQYPEAAVALGFIYDTVDDNYDEAFASYNLAAMAKDPIGEYDLALMYSQGKGRPVDYEKAQTIYLTAANQGYKPAMVSLAELYFNGRAGSRDEDEALHWYKNAAEAGDREAMYQLGLLSETGVATKLDYSEAINYYQKAANAGDVKATLALARMYQYGLGVNKDVSHAEMLYKELSALGNAYAQYQLALLYAETNDKATETRRLLQQAQDNGSQQARQTLQWLNAQKAISVSFIEPAPLSPMKFIVDQSAELMYLDALNAWNHGDEVAFRMILSHILGQYPNYLPAKRAYDQLPPDAWG